MPDTALHQAPGADIPQTGAEAGTILIVDDSRLQRRILSLHLQRLGLRVIEAASAEEALALCRTDPPDIVISDWLMQGMTGLEFCRAFRAQNRERYGYFILLTSKTEKSAVAQGLENGADDFLTKPVSVDELRGRIAAGRRILQMERRLHDSNRLISTTLEELRGLYETISRDLMEARRLQESLIRERYRSFGNSEVSLFLRPSGHVGGDLVGFFPINARRVAIYAIDVAGHGIASAMLSARLGGYLSAASPEQNVALRLNEFGIYDAHEPARVAEILNAIALREMRVDRYFTLAYADIDLISGAVSFVQAGHPHPAVIHADGRVSFPGEGGLPIGLIEDAAYSQHDIRLAPGDRLLLMSDGMTEAEDAQGRPLGEAGLAALIADLGQRGGLDFLDALVERLGGFTGADFADDLSGVLFEFRGAKENVG